MSNQISTGGRRAEVAAGAGFAGFIRAVAPDDPTIGGKARSLGRLRALGLPVPDGFAIATSLFRALRAGGPPLPARFVSAADLAALDAARDALETALLPAGFEGDLAAALDALDSRATRDARATHETRDLAPSGSAGAAVRRSMRFSVRSSAAGEDRAGALGAGVYASEVDVARGGVADAVRRVLASCLTPAAWVYDARVGGGAPGGSDDAHAGIAVLVHPFVDGDAAGTAAIATGGDAPADALVTVHVDARVGQPNARARAAIEAAARAAAARFGPIEIEWVAVGDTITLLQLRAYQAVTATSAAPATTNAAATVTGAGTSVADAVGWTWDAAHNPAPLSAAQAGLVALVDARCRIGIRQKVIGGYLFFRASDDAADAAPPDPHRAAASNRLSDRASDGAPASPTTTDTTSASTARAAFDALRASVDDGLRALGATPALPAMLDLFVDAYQILFGVVAPACRADRQALAAAIGHRVRDSARTIDRLLEGVPSVATRRGAAASAIARATTARDRQRAIDAYLHDFGDESPSWDVAAATLDETPERLLQLAIGAAADPQAESDGRSVEAAAPAERDGGVAVEPVADLVADLVAELVAELGVDAGDQPALDALVAAARDAAAIGEDDDALYARLQAAVRRALLAVGHRLATVGRLDHADDVFDLPLDLSCALASTDAATGPLSTTSHAIGDHGRIGQHDLRALVAEARAATARARMTPPVVSPAAASGAGHSLRGSARILRGLAGAGGRAIGRAVIHPATRPLGPRDVLIASTLLPTELPLLSPGGIVVETGTPLGHVAAQARERGIPAVVGAVGARDALAPGALVLVDGDRGEVVPLGGDPDFSE